ncbi:hypothetical protein [Kribbella sp. NPDC004875]|uniref:hypothetical protein n=1 Tax=Kribbella sp. NPDC004875 TaxID=3364107 RepID=UPI0036D19A10
MADYSKTSMADMVAQLAGLNASGWLQAGETWSVLATDLQTTQDNLQHAWNNTHLFHDSMTFDSIGNEVTTSKASVDAWRPFVERVGTHLSSIGCTIRDTQAVVGGLITPYQEAESRFRSATDAGKAKAAQQEMDDITATAANMMGVLSSEMQQALGRILPVPQSKYGGPMMPNRAEQQPATDDPNAKADPTAGGSPPGAADGVPGQTPAAVPATDPSSPKSPEAKDPWDEAGKIIDVIGKGIDLTGKVPDNLDKWLTLAQHAKDLGGGDASTATTPDLSNLTPKGPLSDEPALAGGVSTTPPTFTPTHFTPTTGGGATGGGLPSIGVPLGGGIGGGHTTLPASTTGTSDRGTPSLRSATTAGEAGAEPSLSGRTSTASTGTQSSPSPMYPPMSGAGAGAGAGARSEIRPGAAASKSGFTVPTEATAVERMRRQGVQSDLQGRTNGERRTPSGAPPLRKRGRPARARRTGGEEVLDEELWKL